jgi:hypothetical protein
MSEENCSESDVSVSRRYSSRVKKYVLLVLWFLIPLKASPAKLDFAACFTYVKCSFRVRLHKNDFIVLNLFLKKNCY